MPFKHQIYRFQFVFNSICKDYKFHSQGFIGKVCPFESSLFYRHRGIGELRLPPLTLSPLNIITWLEKRYNAQRQLRSTTTKGAFPMSQVIAIVNQKGGVAKTTTAVNLAAALVRQDEKVLCIDLDPQANLTMSLGCQSPDELPHTVSDVIDKAITEQPLDPSEGVIRHAEGIDLMPASIQLSGYENLLINEYGRENILRQYVDAVRPFYDRILIDCQPSLNILTINALVAADSVLIPTL
jgi:ATPases involved in chromosome partitioning